MLNEPPAHSRPQLPWKSMGIGAGLTVILVVLIVFASVYHSGPAGQQQNAYSAQLAVANPKVSQADTMMAGSVTYWDADLVNQGGKTVTACTVTLTFLDPYGKPVQTATEDLIGPKAAPLGPHQQRHIQIGFEQISYAWNQAPPKVTFQHVYVK